MYSIHRTSLVLATVALSLVVAAFATFSSGVVGADPIPTPMLEIDPSVTDIHYYNILGEPGIQVAAKGLLPEIEFKLRVSPDELSAYVEMYDLYWEIPEGTECPECDTESGLHVWFEGEPSPQPSKLYIDPSVLQVDLSRDEKAESGFVIAAEGTFAEGEKIVEVSPPYLWEYIDSSEDNWILNAGTQCGDCVNNEVIKIESVVAPLD